MLAATGAGAFESVASAVQHMRIRDVKVWLPLPREGRRSYGVEITKAMLEQKFAVFQELRKDQLKYRRMMGS